MKKKGFTLVELLATIAILAVLISLSLVVYNRVKENVLNQELENTVSYIETQAKNYANDTNITVISVEDLILAGYVEPDDETDIYNPVTNESLNCYIVKSTYEDGKFTSVLELSEENYIGENGKCTPYEKGENIIIGVSENGINYTASNSSEWYKDDVWLAGLLSGSTLQGELYEFEWKSNLGTTKTTEIIKTETVEGVTSKIPYTLNIRWKEEKKKAEASTTINIDKEPPEVVDITIKDESKWTNKDKEVTINVTDFQGSGIAGIYVGEKNCNEITEEEYIKITENKYTTTKDNGKFNVCLIDKVGNKSVTEHQFEIKYVDKVAPSCTITTTATKGTNNWYTQNATLVLNTVDKESGINKKGLTTSRTANYNNVTTVVQRDTKGVTYYGYVEDVAGNKGNCKLDVKVDTTPPSMSFSISGLNKATIKCSDDISGINGATSMTQSLTGTRNYTVTKTCTNNAGLSVTSSHTYTYSNCARGHNTCRYGCDEYYDSCKYGSNTCSYGCDTTYDSCATGSNTCQGGYTQNCTTQPVCTGGYTTIYCCYAHVGSTSCSETTTPCVMGGGISRYECKKYTYQEVCTTGDYDSCISGSNTCQGGNVTDYGSCDSCYYGSNTCQGGYVQIPSTCDSCYYGENTCEGGFLY